MDSSSRDRSTTNYVFVAPDPGRWVLRTIALGSLVCLCVFGTLTITDRSLTTMIAGGVAAALLVISWAMLQAKIPQRITVRGPMVQIRRDGEVHRFDLEDPSVDIRVRDGEIAFSHYMDRWVVVRSRDVDWKVFTDVVMAYQNKADRNAEERDKRFSR
jgi:hypothetical protein